MILWSTHHSRVRGETIRIRPSRKRKKSWIGPSRKAGSGFELKKFMSDFFLNFRGIWILVFRLNQEIQTLKKNLELYACVVNKAVKAM